MRPLSDQLLAEMYADSNGAVLVPLVKLEHVDWEMPVCLARNAEPVSHGGETYVPFPMELSLPDDEDEGLPILRWTAQNVVREIMWYFRRVSGVVRGTVVYVQPAVPGVVEIGPFEVEISGIEYDEQTLSGVMTIEPILEEAFGYLTMTPGTTPALF
ncbi:DUF1833 family protein [Salipiger mangrovisoli]|uniref:DUF1833 family protein n=1 Tax=Salipiger mangrovisoli TaxID=2865933 RepID=A0ABR9WWY0_9RHOB|nr:DUF1833 family protein [Salipiger mangrovisoli]MBE9635783.1 DUF1833 family protein [Salipiger mangrovisoli]